MYTAVSHVTILAWKMCELIWKSIREMQFIEQIIFVYNLYSSVALALIEGSMFSNKSACETRLECRLKLEERYQLTASAKVQQQELRLQYPDSSSLTKHCP